MKHTIEEFLSQVRILADGTLLFRGNPAQPSAAPDADLATKVTEFVYKYLYTHPSGDIGNAFLNEQPDKELIAQISSANQTKPKPQDGWVVRTVMENGAVIAERCGKVRKFLAGQFLASADACPIVAGSPIVITHMAGSMTVQPGFFHIFGQESLDLAEQAKTVRLYVNLAATGSAAPVAGLISGTLNRYKIPFTYKTTVRTCDYSRTDAAVLYLPKRMFHVSAMALAPQLDVLTGFLDPDVPTFTKRLAHGIGLAEDPAGAVSFGASRSGLIAKAMLSSQQDQAIDAGKFWDQFTISCAEQRLQLDALHLNPGSDDIYDLQMDDRMAAE